MYYKVFIDDSGNKEYLTPYSWDFAEKPPNLKDHRQFWRENYFVLCGVKVKETKIAELNNGINLIKEKFFGTKKIEIKSVWLRNSEKRKRHYLEPFNISEENLKIFGEEILTFISKNKSHLKLIGVVFDKRFYGNRKRSTPDGSPLLKSTQVMLERIHYSGGYNIVIFDQLEESLKVEKGNHGKILNILKNNGSMGQIYVNNYDRISDVKFLRSCNENFLQIADLCAYNIYRQFIEHGRDWCGNNLDGTGSSVLNTYKRFYPIRCNFVCHPSTGRVRGMGLICVPDTGKVDWNIQSGC